MNKTECRACCDNAALGVSHPRRWRAVRFGTV